MTLNAVPNTASVDQLAEIIMRDGGVVINDFLRPEQLDPLVKQSYDALESVRTGDDAEFMGSSTRRISRCFATVPLIVDVALHPLYIGTAKAILEKPVPIWVGQERKEITSEIHVGSTQIIDILPGQKTQPLHRDDMVFMWRHPDYGREGRVQIMVAGTDFTEENGATRVIPGSNKWDDERMPTNEETIPAEMKAGSAMIWIGSMYHGGGANVSSGARLGISMSYDLSNLVHEENPFLSYTTEQVKAMPRQVQKLLGWSAGRNFMGWIEKEGQLVDPSILLQDDDAKPELVTY